MIVSCGAKHCRSSSAALDFYLRPAEKERVMYAAQFALPVRIVMRPGEPVTEIYSAEEALELLMAWPTQEGRIFNRALEACLAASADPGLAEDARRQFVAFANASSIMARDVPLDSLYENGELKPLYR